MDQLRRSLFSSFLITLFASYVVNIAAFTHVHYEDGKVVTHTHPHHGKHSHSGSEYSCLITLSHFFSFDPFIPYIQLEREYVLHIYTKKNTVLLVEAEQFSIPDLRAPPSFKNVIKFLT